jgi:hypothetical protein
VIGAPIAISGVATINSSRCSIMWSKKNVVSYVPIGDSSAMKMTRSPAYHATSR